MVLELIGHDYKYAVEQVMLTLFPEERPVYGGCVGADSISARVQLSHGAKVSTAVTVLWYEGVRYRGVARAARQDAAPATGKNRPELVRERTMQKIIKLSFYRAATAATGQVPPWGALTGIRPGKRATALLETGAAPGQVQRIFVKEYEVAPQRAALCIATARAGLAVKASLAPQDICLYVGIPFCPTRCAYCSFVALDVEKSTHLVEPFLAALERETATTANVVRALGLRPVALYIGGGTPTTLTAAQLAALTGSLSAHFDLSHLREYTVEAGRPDTLDMEKLYVLRDAGVTRVSVNPQSMDDAVLTAIGRKHTAGDIVRAVEMARSVGFPVLNMDLIAGLPADTAAGFARTLEQVLALGAENITVHTLARKKGAQIKTDDVPAPGSEAVEEMLGHALTALPDAGYAPYYLYRQKFTAGGFENVGWCKPGAENLYNIAIMEELCSILSLGGGASTKLVNPHTGRIPRMYNPKFPLEYAEGIDRILASKENIRTFYTEEDLTHGTNL
ncbi:MAG: coproporphyrinogen dehydrogenase HemZ [Oscillospiraceae bacterium]|nr:coproporphyrinogen dehydrogenase HemZ [Oscillospiraceae bacterium]